jgi:hypothetical protein
MGNLCQHIVKLNAFSPVPKTVEEAKLKSKKEKALLTEPELMILPDLLAFLENGTYISELNKSFFGLMEAYLPMPKPKPAKIYPPSTVEHNKQLFTTLRGNISSAPPSTPIRSMPPSSDTSPASYLGPPPPPPSSHRGLPLPNMRGASKVSTSEPLPSHTTDGISPLMPTSPQVATFLTLPCIFATRHTYLRMHSHCKTLGLATSFAFTLQLYNDLPFSTQGPPAEPPLLPPGPSKASESSGATARMPLRHLPFSKASLCLFSRSTTTTS